MRTRLSRTDFQARLSATFSSHTAIQAALGDSIPDFPDTLNNWMARLKLLYGVPFNYLVPDEGMLPPESIRFFYVDVNWIDAMVDGAYSIGRDLTSDQTALELNMDKAVFAGLHTDIDGAAGAIRATGLGQPSDNPPMEVISGFLLRSKIIAEYPSFGVYAYEKDHTPNDPNPVMMTILRLEKLGDQSDTMLCLFAGDAFRVDIHEAPEHLHYGINDYSVTDGKISAHKVLQSYTKVGDSVTLNGPISPPTDISGCFRAVSPRTLKISGLATVIQNANDPQASIQPFDSAEMGFEMTEGVGLVSFFNTSASSK